MSRSARAVLAVALACTLSACGSLTTRERNVIGAGAAMLAMGVTPSNDLEQIYYIGVFDPTEQVPEMIYRVRVRGQASMLNSMQFASGWVHADLIDSLNSKAVGVPQDVKGIPDCSATPSKCTAPDTGRRLMMFGPEGFREAPRDHRLVIVMGATAQGFFSSMDKALGDYSAIKSEHDNAPLQRQFLHALIAVKDDQDKVQNLKLELVREGVQ